MTIGRSIIKRFDAHGVAGHEQAVLGRIPDGEGKYSSELLQTRFAPTGIRFQQDFRIAIGAKAFSVTTQAVAKLSIVIDFAVEYDPVPCLWIVHRLMPKRRKVDDGEPAMSESNFSRVVA